MAPHVLLPILVIYGKLTCLEIYCLVGQRRRDKLSCAKPTLCSGNRKVKSTFH